jgi:Flp pilus assembly protein TadG
MNAKCISSGILSRLLGFRRDRRGVAAVEFALVLPLMLTIYMGGVEFGDGYAVDTRVTDVAHSVADLTTQYIQIDNADMSSILNASSVLVSPYSSANITVTVSEVTIDSSGNATITWSDSLNGTARSVGSKITLPTSLQTMKSTSMILGEVTYAYTPAIGYVLTGTINMADSFYMLPRLANSVTRINS